MDYDTVMVGAAELRAAVESGRKVFGPDHDIMIARTPAWGNSDVCLIVRGKRHEAAARGILLASRNPAATMKEETSAGWRGRPAYTYSVVTIPVNGAKEALAT